MFIIYNTLIILSSSTLIEKFKSHHFRTNSPEIPDYYKIILHLEWVPISSSFEECHIQTHNVLQPLLLPFIMGLPREVQAEQEYSRGTSEILWFQLPTFMCCVVMPLLWHSEQKIGIDELQELDFHLQFSSCVCTILRQCAKAKKLELS